MEVSLLLDSQRYLQVLDLGAVSAFSLAQEESIVKSVKAS
jgi:hypothetical protein